MEIKLLSTLTPLLFCLILFTAAAGRYAHADSSPKAEAAEKWFQKYINSQPKLEKVAKLHFYIQDKLGGPNATIWEVARAEITSNSPTRFGEVRVLDDLITAKPSRNSEELGRAQGLITSADLKESGLAMNLNFVFTAGEFNGSTLCILGRNPIDSKSRELPVVGGTGAFRMARGFSISSTYCYDPVENYGVLEYTVYVFYV